MKKAIIASLVALTSGAAITAFALRGPDKLVDLRVNAEPQEYSVTFDFDASDESKPTIETFADNYAICTTTAGGNKVGVVGNHDGGSLAFKDFSFEYLTLFNSQGVLGGPAPMTLATSPAAPSFLMAATWCSHATTKKKESI